MPPYNPSSDIDSLVENYDDGRNCKPSYRSRYESIDQFSVTGGDTTRRREVVSPARRDTPPQRRRSSAPNCDSHQAPASFYCPLTMALMKEPVQDREGNSYEKSAILTWLSDNDTSPITRNRLRRKYLVPNRALKEAIEHSHEVKRQETIRNNNVIPPPPPPPLASPPPLRQTRHKTNASVQRRSASRKKTITSSSLPTSSANLATLESSTTAADCHREIINSFLSSIGVKSRLDRFGIAYLPMNKLQLQSSSSPSSKRNSIDKMNLLMVIEAPPTQHTFKLYTHFNATARHMKRLTNSLLNENNEGPLFSSSNNNGTNDANENKVLHNLLQHGKHKALTLTRICDERVKFVLESKSCEITSTSKLKDILNMFVKVSYRMKKRIEA